MINKFNDSENISNKHSTGTYFTPNFVADWMVQETIKIFCKIESIKTRTNLKILDPAVGEGIFLSNFIIHSKNLSFNSKLADNYKFKERTPLNIELLGIDLNDKFVKQASKKIHKQINELKGTKNISAKIYTSDGLLELKKSKNLFDIIIGNPPYIRQESLSFSLKKELSLFIQEIYPNISKSFSQQADYYLYFILFSLFALKDGGVLSFIVSTSWMNSKFGESFRIFLLHLNYRIKLAHSPKNRLIKDAFVNTIIIFIEKQSIKKNTAVQELESNNPSNKIFDFYILDIIQDPINGKKMLQIKENFSFKRNIISNMLNWESVLLNNHKKSLMILQKLKEFLIPLKKVCNVKTGIYTGLNAFFYFNSETHYSLKPDDKFLYPIIRSPKKFIHWKIDSSKLSHKVFLCGLNSTELRDSYKNTYDYIKWGSKQKTITKQKVKEGKLWSQVISVKNRKPGWWAINIKHDPTNVFLRYIYYQNYINPISDTPIYSDRCFHHIIPKDASIFKKIWAVLNFNHTRLMIDLYGRSSLGQGALKLETMTAKLLPILDCFNCTTWNLYDDYKFENIPEIEQKIYKELRLPDNEKLYYTISNLHEEMVNSRVKKSQLISL